MRLCGERAPLTSTLCAHTHHARLPLLPLLPLQVTGRSFMPLQHQAKPDGTKWRREPVLQTRGSKFIKFQEARLQVRMR